MFVIREWPVVRRDAQAHALLEDPQFLAHWKHLEQRCPWATVYQSVAFARTWYGTYRDSYTPVVIYARNESTLHGLFLLAQPKGRRDLVHVGSIHAEYQAWLATPERSNEFVAGAARVLRDQGARMLKLHFAAPKLPLDELRKLPGSVVNVHVAMHRRGFMAVDEHGTARASLRKKGNRSKLARLGRQGDLSLVQLQTRAELAEVIDRIAEFCDLRQGAINDCTPFRSDPLKRAFYLALMDEPKLLHATVLMAGSTLVAGHLGPMDKSHVSLGVIAHSPFEARHSPAKLLLYLLAERLGEQGYRVFDLTPGGDYKDRFASGEDTVPSLRLFFTPSGYVRHRMASGAVGAIKSLSAAVGFDSGSITDALRQKARLATPAVRAPHRVVPALVRRSARWIRDDGEFRIYRISNDAARELGGEGESLRVDAISDLLQYTPATATDAPKSEFFHKALQRLESGQTVFTHAKDGLLLHYSWLIPCTEEAGSEFGHRYAFAEPSALLWNGYTHPSARGLGLHQASIRARAHHVATHRLAPSIVTGVRSDNGPSRHNIEKLGFEHVGSACMKRRFGRNERWLTGAFLKPLQQP